MKLLKSVNIYGIGVKGISYERDRKKIKQKIIKKTIQINHWKIFFRFCVLEIFWEGELWIELKKFFRHTV